MDKKESTNRNTARPLFKKFILERSLSSYNKAIFAVLSGYTKKCNAVATNKDTSNVVVTSLHFAVFLEVTVEQRNTY